MIFISSTVVAVIILSVIALMVLNMVIIVYVTRAYVDQLESLLKNPGWSPAWANIQALFKYIRVVSRYTGNPETTISNAA